MHLMCVGSLLDGKGEGEGDGEGERDGEEEEEEEELQPGSHVLAHSLAPPGSTSNSERGPLLPPSKVRQCGGVCENAPLGRLLGPRALAHHRFHSTVRPKIFWRHTWHASLGVAHGFTTNLREVTREKNAPQAWLVMMARNLCRHVMGLGRGPSIYTPLPPGRDQEQLQWGKGLVNPLQPRAALHNDQATNEERGHSSPPHCPWLAKRKMSASFQGANEMKWIGVTCGPVSGYPQYWRWGILAGMAPWMKKSWGKSEYQVRALWATYGGKLWGKSNALQQ